MYKIGTDFAVDKGVKGKTDNAKGAAMKPRRKDYADAREYYQALAQWLDDKAAEYLMKANDIREKYGV